jgi:ubiquinone/menaquinone biosynthesis C-methylase UbiE
LYGNKVLDVGCGTGALLLNLHLAGYTAYGLDKSEDMIKICRKKFSYRALPITIFHSECTNIPLNNEAVDSVVATFPTDYILDEKCYKEIHRVLSNEGRLLILDEPYFIKKNPINYLFNFLVSFGSDRKLKDIANSLNKFGFETSIEIFQDTCSSVKLLVANKKNHNIKST